VDAPQAEPGQTQQESAATGAEAVAARIRAAVRGAFLAKTAEHARPPGHLGLSGLGGCTRKAAYAIAGTPPSDQPPPDEARAANLGVIEHEGLLPLIAEQLGAGASYEQEVTLRAGGLSIVGHLDLMDLLDDVGAVAIVDLKTVGEHRLYKVRRDGVMYADHRTQLRGYGLAALQAGKRVRWLVAIYLDRASGDFEVIVEEFTNSAALAVIDRVEELKLHATDPDNAPRDEYGPGLSFTCDGCEWLRACWGPEATPGQVGAQVAVVGPNDDGRKARVEAVLKMYGDAQGAESESKKVKEFAKAILERVPYGKYGAWKYGRDKDSAMADEEQIRKDYAARGEVVPTKPKRGNIRIGLIGPAK